MTPGEIINLLNEKLGDGTAQASDISGNPPAIVIGARQITEACLELSKNEKLYFDLLECITGIDNGPGAGTMEVIYHLYSIPFDIRIALRVIVPRQSDPQLLPEVPSVSSIWKTAEWLERETFDLTGIKFTGNNDLRRILLPADWTGFPLRKDYSVADYYHGVKIRY